ncbi:hypothetical protein MKZ38_003857 [Zalerion maritima]|uniref:TM2 domain-containing protein n=1 Tax=Zalerion maritima TaxID=339359 RepID=A0AAD5WQC8_9PEZI|nr:hypothetical protein MKZ38_003857 [Zalerion maritima]
MLNVLPGYQPTFADRAGAAAGTAVTGVFCFLSRRWRFIATYQGVCFMMLIAYLFAVDGQIEAVPQQHEAELHKRAWGGYNEQPMSEKCYRQERTAMLLNLFLGGIAADQWYAHHWVLAVFKFITIGGLGLWAMIDMILWIVGGVYGTPGCPGGAGAARSWAY